MVKENDVPPVFPSSEVARVYLLEALRSVTEQVKDRGDLDCHFPKLITVQSQSGSRM